MFENIKNAYSKVKASITPVVSKVKEAVAPLVKSGLIGIGPPKSPITPQLQANIFKGIRQTAEAGTKAVEDIATKMAACDV